MQRPRVGEDAVEHEPPHRDGNNRTFSDKVEDATITASVKSKLLWNTRTDGLDIGVDTVAGKVTLSGAASSAEEKDLAGIFETREMADPASRKA